jgi:hypothetical protein
MPWCLGGSNLKSLGTLVVQNKSLGALVVQKQTNFKKWAFVVKF